MSCLWMQKSAKMWLCIRFSASSHHRHALSLLGVMRPRSKTGPPYAPGGARPAAGPQAPPYSALYSAMGPMLRSSSAVDASSTRVR